MSERPKIIDFDKYKERVIDYSQFRQKDLMIHEVILGLQEEVYRFQHPWLSLVHYPRELAEFRYSKFDKRHPLLSAVSSMDLWNDIILLAGLALNFIQSHPSILY